MPPAPLRYAVSQSRDLEDHVVAGLYILLLLLVARHGPRSGSLSALAPLSGLHLLKELGDGVDEGALRRDGPEELGAEIGVLERGADGPGEQI